MKKATAITISLAIFLFPTLTGNAQETINRKTYSSSGTTCIVETEVDLFTEEEIHKINCIAPEGLIEKNLIGFAVEIGATEEKNIIVLQIANELDSADIGFKDALIRIDQNVPYTIESFFNSDDLLGITINEFGPTSNESKYFLMNVKNGKQRLMMRIEPRYSYVALTEAMPLNSQVTEAIEDFLNRTENLPAFRILD